MTQGNLMTNNKVDPYGGYVKGTDGQLSAPSLTQANPGVATVVVPDQFKIKVGGPYTVTISGVTGANAGDINGSRTFTRTGDATGTIGVDTSLMIFTATAMVIDGIPLEPTDANVPTSQVRDFQGP